VQFLQMEGDTERGLARGPEAQPIYMLLKPPPMGRVGKGQACSVVGCSNRAERSLAASDAAMGGLEISREGRRSYLCSQHYKQWKKAMRKKWEYERARWEV
jgi:hypothetical protein